jgi:hypothetical protein
MSFICECSLIFRMGVAFALATVIGSCSTNSDQLRQGEFSVPVCTGFNLKNGENVPYGIIGVPNNKLASDDKLKLLAAFPIPTKYTLSISTNILSNKKIWLTKAVINSNLNNNIYYFNSPFQVVGGAPIIYLNDVSDQEIAINVSSLPKGYYRLYLKSDEDLLWENIIIE